MVCDSSGVSRLRAVRWWHGLVSVVVAAGVGVVTNLATDEFSWTLSAVLVALVGVQVGLVVWQAGRDRRDLRDARDAVLGPLRPSVPDPPMVDASGDGAWAVVHWLTAPFSPTPLWGRSGVRDRLLAWCVERDPRAGVVRVVTGPAGVGKSRLALAVAESLPAGWAAGRLPGGGEGLVERVVAAGDPTLVIVDDADRVPGLDTLITQAARHPDLVRLLLLTRAASALHGLPDPVLPQVARVEQLGPLGEAGDRQRWFAQAVRAYARAFRVPPPDLPDRPVGDDEDTPLVLHARALLAVLGRAGSRTWSLAGIVTELVVLEQRAWAADLARLPDGCDPEVLAEAITVLVALPASTVEEAAELLRRVPQFAHDTAHQSRIAVARWAHRRYPPGPDHRLDLRPHLIGERLLLDTLTRTPRLLHDDTVDATPVLARAYTTFPDALDHLGPLLTRRRNLLPDALAAVLATSTTGRTLDRLLASLLDADDIADDVETRARLIGLSPPEAFPHLRISLSHLLVTHYRELAEAEPGQFRSELARSLQNLGIHLWAVGRYREALAAAEEAVAVERELVAAEPDRYRADLARSLINLGLYLRAVGRRREALAAAEETVAARRESTEAEPARYRAELAESLNFLGIHLRDVGRHREALETTEEAVAIRRELTRAEPARYRGDLAESLDNLGLYLQEVGRYRDALAVGEESFAHYRELAEAEPARYRPKLAQSLTGIGIYLWRLDRHREALAATEEAVAINRELARAEPGRHGPDLAESLRNLGVGRAKAGDVERGLQERRAAVAVWKDCAERDPELYGATYRRELAQLRRWLDEIGRHGEAAALDLDAPP